MAWVSVRVLRSDAAWALPRPSATASAKLANRRVNQSQRMIWNEKPRLVAAGDEILDEQDGRESRHDLDHEHDRVPDHDARVELGERCPKAGTMISDPRKRVALSRYERCS